VLNPHAPVSSPERHMPANANGLRLRRSRVGVVGVGNSAGRSRVRLATGARDSSSKRPDKFCSPTSNLYSGYGLGGGDA
jgi:hypothetical protein